MFLDHAIQDLVWYIQSQNEAEIMITQHTTPSANGFTFY